MVLCREIDVWTCKHLFGMRVFRKELFSRMGCFTPQVSFQFRLPRHQYVTFEDNAAACLTPMVNWAASWVSFELSEPLLQLVHLFVIFTYEDTLEIWVCEWSSCLSAACSWLGVNFSSMLVINYRLAYIAPLLAERIEAQEGGVELGLF